MSGQTKMRPIDFV